MELITLIGLFFFPRFTLGCVLCHYDHEVLGVLAIIISFIETDDNKNEKKG